MYFKVIFIVKRSYSDVIMLTCHVLGAFSLVALPKAWVRNFKQNKREDMVILISFPHVHVE